MKKNSHLLSLLIALTFHLSIFFILYSSRQYSPIQSTITRVSLLNILSEPTHDLRPPVIAVAKTIEAKNKNTEKTNYVKQRDQPASQVDAQDNQIVKQQAGNEPVINGLDTALNSTASSVISQRFNEKKPPPNLKEKPEEHRTALAKEMAKAVRPDCKTAYQNLGVIIAPLALIHDTVRDKGCQW